MPTGDCTSLPSLPSRIPAYDHDRAAVTRLDWTRHAAQPPKSTDTSRACERVSKATCDLKQASRCLQESYAGATLAHETLRRIQQESVDASYCCVICLIFKQSKQVVEQLLNLLVFFTLPSHPATSCFHLCRQLWSSGTASPQSRHACTMKVSSVHPISEGLSGYAQALKHMLPSLDACCSICVGRSSHEHPIFMQVSSLEETADDRSTSPGECADEAAALQSLQCDYIALQKNHAQVCIEHYTWTHTQGCCQSPG